MMLKALRVFENFFRSISWRFGKWADDRDTFLGVPAPPTGKTYYISDSGQWGNVLADLDDKTKTLA